MSSLRKAISLVSLSILMLTPIAVASDYVQVDVGWAIAGKRYFEVPFYMLHDSTEIGSLTSGSNGFLLTEIGPGYTDVHDIVPDPSFPGNIYYSFDNCDGIAPDTLLVGFTGDVPASEQARPYFTLIMHLDTDASAICFDSTSVISSWLWTGTSGTVVPGFLDTYLEAGSPHCFWPEAHPCEYPVFVTTPPDDRLFRYTDCGSLEFGFEVDLSIAELVQFSVVYGPGYATQTGLMSCDYTCQPLPADTYHVELEAFACWVYSYYEFDLIFSDDERPLGDCGCDGRVDIDDVVYLIAYIFTGGPEPYADPDCTGEVDIDDVVYLIAYIFSGGPAPCG